MTYEDLRNFATKHNIDNDEYGVYFKDYTLYPDKSIWVNKRSYGSGLDISFQVAEDRTPRQMLQFLESLM